MKTFYQTLKIDDDMCPPGCDICSVKCREVKSGKGYGGSGIRTAHIPELNAHAAYACNQCSEPACLDVCPVGAISRSASDGLSGSMSRNASDAALRLACPYGGIRLSRRI